MLTPSSFHYLALLCNLDNYIAALITAQLIVSSAGGVQYISISTGNAGVSTLTAVLSVDWTGSISIYSEHL